MYQIDFDCLIKAFKEKGIKCIFSYDFFQVLSYTEQNRNIPEQLKQQEEFVENKLSDKIRTNAEIVSFIKNVIDLKNKPKGCRFQEENEADGNKCIKYTYAQRRICAGIPKAAVGCAEEDLKAG